MTGFEGNGPVDGISAEMELITVGTDPVATDTVANLVMGFDQQDIPTIVYEAQQGLGTMDLR
jgi:uncharacterized protein (DUF362 family)